MLNITYINPEKLRKNSWNTNKVSPENESKLDRSLKEFGIFKPVLCRTVNDELEIIGGEHRVESAVRNGYLEIPIIDLGEITDDKAKKIGLLDNGRYGSDDFRELQELLDSLEDLDTMANILPFSVEELETMISSASVDLETIPSFDEEDNNNLIEEVKESIREPETHITVKFKIPLTHLQDFNRAIESKKKTLPIQYDDEMKNAGEAILRFVFSESF